MRVHVRTTGGVQRITMFRINDHLVSAGRVARRASASLGLAALLLGSTLGAPPTALPSGSTAGAPRPTLSQGPIIRDHRNGGPPAARIQVNLKSVTILNDRDWGKGEMEFYFQLTCFQLSESSPPCVGGYGSAHL